MGPQQHAAKRKIAAALRHPARKIAGALGGTRMAARALLLLTGLGIAHGLLPNRATLVFAVPAVAAAVLTLWRHTAGSTKRLTFLFTILAALAALWAPAGTLSAAGTRSAEVVSLLFATQVLADSVTYGGYDRIVRSLLARLRWPARWTALLGGYVFSWGFLMTSIPVLYGAIAGLGAEPAAAGSRDGSGEREGAGAAGSGEGSGDRNGAAAAGSGEGSGKQVDDAGSGHSAPSGRPAAPGGVQGSKQVVKHEGLEGVDLSILLSRAFASATMVTPLQSTVLLAIATSGAEMTSYILAALPLSLILLLAGALDMPRGGHPAGNPASAAREAERAAASGTKGEEPAAEYSVRGYVLLGLFFASLVLSVLIVSRLPVQVMAGQALALSSVAVLWGRLGRRAMAPVGGRTPPRNLRALGRDYVGRLSDGILLVSMGSMAGITLAATPLMEYAAIGLRGIQNELLAGTMVMAVIIIMRLAGVAPAVILVTVGPVLAAGLTMAPVSMALIMAVGSGMASILSPFSMSTALAVSLTGDSALYISIRRQTAYAVLAIAITLAYSYFF